MNITPDELRRHYESLPDLALLELDTSDLVASARELVNAEIARRGLKAAASTAAAEPDSPPPAAAAEPAEFVCITEYDYMDEADIACGLLVAAGIEARVDHEPPVFRLMTSPAAAEQALGMLVTPISEDDLAAQAEAAGAPEDDE